MKLLIKELMRVITDDLLALTHEGIVNFHGHRYHAVCLRVVGDWMFIAKAGHLSRSSAPLLLV